MFKDSFGEKRIVDLSIQQVHYDATNVHKLYNILELVL